MSGRFVRASKYRHVFGKPTRKEFCYDNLHISRNAWDSNLVKANPEYLSVNWESSGGGAFAVIPVEERGKLPDQIPLFRGHTGPVLDTDWNPFNDHVIASASDDGKVCLWNVPQNFTLYTDAEDMPNVAPSSTLSGHTRKVGYVLWNPAAENILASASGDFSVKVWDASTGSPALSLVHNDLVQSMSWNASGTLLVTTSRDKKITLWDVRQEKPASQHAGHAGAKNSRVVWMGEHNRFATTGFSKMSERQIALWEPGNSDPIGGFTMLDSISGVCMPFWDEGSNCLYLAGKGDGNIRYFEYEADKFEFLTEYKSGDPQRGIGFVPRRGINVRDNEVMRGYKTVNDTYIEPISFTVPRRAEVFQADLYPPATGLKPAESAQEWLNGKSDMPPKISLESIYNNQTPVEVAPTPAAAAPAPAAAEPQPIAAPVKKEEPVPVSRSVPASVKDQKESISNMANKYKDNEEASSSETEEPSSFDEVPARSSSSSRPTPRSSVVFSSGTTPQPLKSSTVAKTNSGTGTPVRSPITPRPIPLPIVPTPTAMAAAAAAGYGSGAPSRSSSPVSNDVLIEIKKLIEAQTTKIEALTREVELLKRKVEGPAGAQDQSERIRLLELELEAARS
ncbi:Coronin-like protein crn1 [Ceratocystis fimbriata CBS 114723]|uniref:Coronin n=1 Tax=Ceratocystis fimbriata CBS 114723 TaxID=1035309 RepID=A0A2C5XA95_9PEZI|nr:Coronin-like protein crn1 [Ceratocystis fimbriata CBS 114723]